MRKVVRDFKVTHIFANGSVMTDKEFMSQPYVVAPEKNKEWYNDVAKEYDPFYVKKHISKVERERVDRRRNELEQEILKVKEELIKL